MKKLYTITLVLLVFATSYGQPFNNIWQKNANSVDYTWFTPTGNDVNSIEYNPATGRLLVAKRGSAIYIIDPANGAQVGTMNVTGITDGLRFNKIRVTSDGVIYAIQIVTSPGNVNIWRWADQNAAPALCATFACTERCGDAFGLSGTGTNTILYASGSGTTANAFNIYILNTFNGTNFFLESKLTMTSSPTTNQQWANRTVEPVSNSLTSDLWIKGGGFVARKISVGPLNSGVRTGTLVTTILDGTGNGQASVGYGGMRHVTSPGGNKFLIFSGGNNSNAGTKMKMINVTDELNPVTFGLDSLGDPSTYITNGNGTGDATYKFEGDGYTVFYLSTNNGIEATRAGGQELPVTFGSFNASIRNKSVLCDWNTLMENNNDGFAIEKSIDGRNFSRIGFIKSMATNGNSTAPLQYQFEDTRLLKGKSYYRLKQLDKDGKASYSQIRAIQSANVNALSATVLSNPILDEIKLNVKSPADKKVLITVINASGALLMSKQQQILSGENNLALPCNNLPKGGVVVTIKDIEGKQLPIVFKLIKQ